MTTATVNLAQVRRNADAIRARLNDPQDDPLAHALSYDALDLADEVERLRAKRDAYRDSALMYAARVAELNDEIAKLRAAAQQEENTR